MRFYTKQHRYYCGIDLHARSMYVCILDSQGEILLHRNMACAPELFLKAVAPYREDIAVAVECMFTWYWLADLCSKEKIPFVLGHALYMKAIHGGKAKNDKIDAHKIAVLLRRHAPHGLCLPARDASDPRPASPPHVPRAQTRRALGPHPEHQQPVQPARRSAKRSPTKPTAKEWPNASAILARSEASRSILSLIDHYDKLAHRAWNCHIVPYRQRA